MPPFDPEAPYRLSPRVGLRPEPFGALAYHYDTRRLVFLKSPDLVDLVRALEQHASAGAAIDAVVAPAAARRPAYVTALASLCESGVVEPLEPAA
ncbi:MAG TPA: mycofactocin biosynthesis chaperone MftB [Acidimicrobiales bacterium]|nr:mycofactocin biosynthesis chaperone MftB [Acidimicrobiales bacterium]